MKKITKWFFSIKSALVMLLLFAASIGVATFIENDYGTATARALVYNARWFEVLLALLALNLLYNIFRFRLFRKEKFFTGLFHLSFLIILLGAAVTRYFGYEGMMHIREGGMSDRIKSSQTYLDISAKEGGKIYRYEEPLYMSKLGENHFKRTIDFNDKRVTVTLEKYIPGAHYEIVPDKNAPAAVELVLSAGKGRVNKVLQKGESIDIGGAVISFGKKIEDKPTIMINDEGNLTLLAPYSVEAMSMGTFEKKEFAPHKPLPLQKRHLYSIAGLNLVLKNYYPHAKKVLVADKKKKNPYPDALKLKIEYDGKTKEIVLFGKEGVIGEPQKVKIGDLDLELRYGAKYITLPFALKLRDFQLERYPGSMSPSSYASEVTVIDKEKNKTFDYRIYMNHVLDYRGYRFFQSSYDMDEKGTILSVNHDPGTIITYIGYFLLFFGMIAHFFMPQSRFQKLMRLAQKIQEQRKNITLALVALFFSTYSWASGVDLVKKIDKTHADRFGAKILVQSREGRIEPMDTLTKEVMAKVARNDELYGADANQWFLAMTVFPDQMRNVEMIYVHHPYIKKLIGLKPNEKYAAFEDFFDKNGHYKLLELVKKATRTKSALRNQLDKDLIKVDERVNVVYMVYTGDLLRIIPNIKDKNGAWITPIQAIKTFPPKLAQVVQILLSHYFQSVDKGVKEGDWSSANKTLDMIAEFQHYYGSAIIPPKSKIKAELLYNKLDIFNHLVLYYLLIGFILLILAIVSLLNPRFNLKPFVRIGVVLVFLGFLAHTIGLALRWYIAGHAPWTDAYESMVFIAWTTVFAGFFFVKRSPIGFAATALMGGLILFVAHLNWLDPQITNLAPVLKSYWLMIHVTVITSSYGFLGLSALLAFTVLVLFLFLSDKNRLVLEFTFKELTYINEMSLIIGLVLITIGNFLGGVWANESWGRYWSWDPKETWAAVTILVYAAVEHMRLVPGLNRLFTYNVASLLAYSSVIMTYFGVNFYLSGMHSYAAGEPVPIPTWVYWAISIVFGLITAAYYKKRKYDIDLKV